MTQPKVLLAPNIEPDLEKLKYPLLASYKMDGYRTPILGGTMYSRTWKVQSVALHRAFKGFLDYCKSEKLFFDAELYAHGKSFSWLASAKAHNPVTDKIKLYVFDMMTHFEWETESERPFNERHLAYRSKLLAKFPNVVPVEQFYVRKPAEIEAYMEAAIDWSFEGLILRDPNARYKRGRGTMKEGIIYKLKKWVTEDAKIIGYEQSTRMTKDYAKGERTRDVMGHLERTSAKGTRELVESIGSIKVQLRNGIVCKVGTAKDADPEMHSITWENRNSFLGRWVEFRHQPHGAKNKPRFGRVIRFRPDIDEE